MVYGNDNLTDDEERKYNTRTLSQYGVDLTKKAKLRRAWPCYWERKGKQEAYWNFIEKDKE